jgi:hypothetical protein
VQSNDSVLDQIGALARGEFDPERIECILVAFGELGEAISNFFGDGCPT